MLVILMVICKNVVAQIGDNVFVRKQMMFVIVIVSVTISGKAIAVTA
jgi:hypothetical protein